MKTVEKWFKKRANLEAPNGRPVGLGQGELGGQWQETAKSLLACAAKGSLAFTAHEIGSFGRALSRVT